MTSDGVNAPNSSVGSSIEDATCINSGGISANIDSGNSSSSPASLAAVNRAGWKPDVENGILTYISTRLPGRR